jgi:hypothetical protein
MQELGLLGAFMQRPHSKLREIGGWFGRESVRSATSALCRRLTHSSR